jgi:CheY-like chemotaxis protein
LSDGGWKGEKAQMKQQTVLFVDDCAEIRLLACPFLRRNGYQVIEARDGLSALMVAQEYAGFIDLLVTDIAMPGMDGVALSARVKGYRPGIRVLFISGSTELADADGAFLSKPFTLHSLLQTMESVLATVPMESPRAQGELPQPAIGVRPSITDYGLR